MSNPMDERRRGLEEEYFNRKNKEALEKLREQMKASEDAKAAGTSSMKCPRCDGSLSESKFEEVTVDTCDKCGGVWLDSEEVGLVYPALARLAERLDDLHDASRPMGGLGASAACRHEHLLTARSVRGEKGRCRPSPILEFRLGVL